MTIVDALKELFVKFGGNETEFDAETVSQALDQISDVAESGGGGWDACIEFDLDANPPTAQFVFGSHDALMEKIDAGRLPTICFKNGPSLFSEFYSFDISYDDEVLQMFVGNDEDEITCFIKADNSIEVEVL